MQNTPGNLSSELRREIPRRRLRKLMQTNSSTGATATDSQRVASELLGNINNLVLIFFRFACRPVKHQPFCCFANGEFATDDENAG